MRIKNTILIMDSIEHLVNDDKNELERDYNLIEHTGTITLILIPKEEKEKCSYLITKYMFYNNNQNKFLSFTQSEDEVSLFVDSNFVMECDSNILRNLSIRHGFKLIQICEDQCGIDHIGIVAEIATVFSANGLSILYVNTFNNNFILIEECDYTKSIKVLKKFCNLE